MALVTYQALIAEFGAALGMEDMAADDDGYIGLQIDDDELHLQYEAEDDKVVLFARLQEVEPERREEIYSMLLAANFFWEGTLGATFSADWVTGRIFLADRRDRGALTADSLAIWVEQFADLAVSWRARIATVNDGGPLPEIGADDSSSQGVWAGDGAPPSGVRV